MTERVCASCHEQYPDDYFASDVVCCFCADKARFGAFAISCGLTRFPHPSGERYVYNADGSFGGKKSENADFLEELWNALVRAKGGGDGLLIGKE